MIAKAGERTVFVLSGVVSVVVSLTTVWIKSAMFWSDGKEIDEALVMKLRGLGHENCSSQIDSIDAQLKISNKKQIRSFFKNILDKISYLNTHG